MVQVLKVECGSPKLFLELHLVFIVVHNFVTNKKLATKKQIERGWESSLEIWNGRTSGTYNQVERGIGMG